MHEAEQSERLYTHHFNMLRSSSGKDGLLSSATTNFSVCIKTEKDDADETFFKRVIDLLSHGKLLPV